MHAHQTGKRGAILEPILLPQTVCSCLVDLQRLHDIGAHFDLDLVKQPRLGRIQGVIKVKDPLRDMAETVL